MSQTVDEWTAVARKANAAKSSARITLRQAANYVAHGDYMRAREHMLQATLLMATAEECERRADAMVDDDAANASERANGEQ
jgi:hypothetical protein